MSSSTTHFYIDEQMVRYVPFHLPKPTQLLTKIRPVASRHHLRCNGNRECCIGTEMRLANAGCWPHASPSTDIDYLPQTRYVLFGSHPHLCILNSCYVAMHLCVLNMFDLYCILPLWAAARAKAEPKPAVIDGFGPACRFRKPEPSKPGQSHSFQAKPGQNITMYRWLTGVWPTSESSTVDCHLTTTSALYKTIAKQTTADWWEFVLFY